MPAAEAHSSHQQRILQSQTDNLEGLSMGVPMSPQILGQALAALFPEGALQLAELEKHLKKSKSNRRPHVDASSCFCSPHNYVKMSGEVTHAVPVCMLKIVESAEHVGIRLEAIPEPIGGASGV
jgi:hypothetical protein